MKTEILVTVDHSHPMPDLADQVSARAWTLAGVNSVEGRLAAQAAPTDTEALRHLMGMGEAEIDAELLASGINPDDAVKRADRAIKGVLATIRAERRAIEYGDIVHKQVIAMRAAVVAAKLESPEVGIQWIENTLFGPGHYPDIEAAREMGGAQALFDKEVTEHEAFRVAHPAPVAAQPSQAPVVQAGEYPPLPEPKVARVRCDDCEGSGFLRVSPDPERSDEVCSGCRGRGWASETLVHVEDDIRAFADATCAMRASAGATPAAALTGAEIKALTAMVWGAPCAGRDLAIVTSTVRAMEALGPGERPIDPIKGGRLLDVDACIVEPAAGLAIEGQTP